MVSYELSRCEVTALKFPYLRGLSAGSFLSTHRQLLADVSLVFASKVSARSFSFLKLTTFASKSRALAVAFNIISQRASVFLVSRWSCLIASTWPVNSYASPRRAWAKEPSATVEFHSLDSVPRITIFSLNESVLWSHFVFFLSRVARLGLVNLKANLFQGFACMKPIAGPTERFYLFFFKCALTPE